MGPIWGRLDPDGPHVGPMNFPIFVVTPVVEKRIIIVSKCYHLQAVAKPCNLNLMRTRESGDQYLMDIVTLPVKRKPDIISKRDNFQGVI